MKLLFINAVLGGDFSALDISITALATYLNKHTNHKAEILDFVFHRRSWKKHLKNKLDSFKPDAVAFSVNTLYLEYIKKTAAQIRKTTNLPIIMGGYHASIHPESLIKYSDAIIIGDGEYVLSDYLTKLEKKESIKGIKGLWAKESGKYIRNQGGAFIKNLDNLPIPDWDLWEDLDKYFYYLGMLYIIGSRGCPYRCTYCDAHQISDSVEGHYYRIKDPVKYAKEIISQWNKYKSRGMRLAQLFDQVPTISKDWLEKFTSVLIKNNDPELKYSMYSRIDNLDEEKMGMLAKSGCAILRMGVEAGNDRIRNQVYKKDLTKAQIKKIFLLTKKYKIATTAYYMVGGPAESKKTINETIDLAKELKGERSAFFVFKPFTKQSEILLKKFGGKIDEKRWKKADNITFDAVVILKDINPWQVELMQKKAYLMTFSRRLYLTIKRKPLRYPIEFLTYMLKGISDGLDPSYLLPYFHIYAYDNVSQ